MNTTLTNGVVGMGMFKKATQAHVLYFNYRLIFFFIVSYDIVVLK
jgi:hypothetical protein